MDYKYVYMSNWYSKLYVSVRWENVISNSYQVLSGVRQGSPHSPTLFNIYINDSVDVLKNTGAVAELTASL